MPMLQVKYKKNTNKMSEENTKRDNEKNREKNVWKINKEYEENVM